jgi:hypothetical protein
MTLRSKVAAVSAVAVAAALMSGCSSGGSPFGVSSSNGGGGGGGPLAGRYFWGTADGRNLLGVYFVDGSHAYSGLPAQGLPTCSGTDQGVGTPQGVDAQGCVAYSFDPSSGAVTVGSDMQGSYSGGSLKLAGLTLAQLDVPSPGARLSVVLTSVSATGAGSDFVGGYTQLVLRPDGDFVVASGADLGTLEGPLTDVPANQQGSYQIGSAGRLTLTYLEGPPQVRTIGLDDEANQRPSLRGALLGTDYYVNQATM